MDYTKCITPDGKNYAGIEKIIARRSKRDYLHTNPVHKDGHRYYANHRPYSLSEDTLEALEIKKKYLNGDISEEEYKGYVLKANLTE